MNLTDELAKTYEKLIQVSDKYDAIWEKIFIELNKYFSFINYKSFDISDKIIYYENGTKDSSKTLRVILSLSSKYKIKNTNLIASVEIHSYYADEFLKKILSEFCIANNLKMEVVDE